MNDIDMAFVEGDVLVQIVDQVLSGTRLMVVPWQPERRSDS